MSKSIKFKFNFILTVAIIFLISTFFKLTFVYANSYEFKIIAGDKIYTFNDYEIDKKGGYNRLKRQNDIVEGIYLDTLINPVEPTINFNNDNKI